MFSLVNLRFFLLDINTKQQRTQHKHLKISCDVPAPAHAHVTQRIQILYVEKISPPKPFAVALVILDWPKQGRVILVNYQTCCHQHNNCQTRCHSDVSRGNCLQE